MVPGREIYTHKRLRTAVNSLRRNMDKLFTYRRAETKEELKHIHLIIPNTTNSLEGWFSHLKNLLRCHTGLRRDRRNKAIEYIIKKHNESKIKQKNNLIF